MCLIFITLVCCILAEQWFSSLSAVADVLIWLCQMAEEEGLVLLRKISSRSPAASHLRFAPSNPVVRISSFLPQFYGFALNGGEGGIRTPGAISSTTDFESVTFGHSATSPKFEIEKRFKSTWQAWTANSQMFWFATRAVLSSRRTSQFQLVALSCR